MGMEELTFGPQFCPKGGCDQCGFQIDLPPGIYPPGVIQPPPGFAPTLPSITIGPTGRPTYPPSNEVPTTELTTTDTSSTESEDSECSETQTATDTTYYVSYGTNDAGETTTTTTTSTGTELTTGCSVTGTTTDVASTGGEEGTTYTATEFGVTEGPEIAMETLQALASALDAEWIEELKLLGPMASMLGVTPTETETETGSVKCYPA